MILAEHEIQGTTTEITICPLGDIQWSGDRHEIAFDHLNEHIARCLREPNPLFIGMGDYVDFASPSNRDTLRTGKLYDTARKVIDDKALDLTLDVYQQILKPTKGKWLGLLQGHHWYPLRTGGTTDMRLASFLEAPYLGVTGGVQVRFRKKTGNSSQSIKLVAHHGCGSSVFPHGPLNRLYRIAPNWNVDLFLMGHQTKKAYASFDRMDLVFPSTGKPRLDHKTVTLVGAGGWSKGYIEGKPEGTYVEQGLFAPVALGQPIVHVRPKWRRSTHFGVELWEPNISVEA